MGYYNNGGYRRDTREGMGYSGHKDGYSGRGSYGSYSRRRSVQKKRSGASYGTTRGSGKAFIRGWNASRRNGLVVYLCTPYKKTKTVKDKWENWMCTIQRQGLPSQIVSCMVDITTRRAIIQDCGIVINPNKNYCGSYGRKR